ncbi:hypothetical protein D0894_26550 [Pseudomonas monteilii]|uniref:Uncharacterized protein n=1 Tax=Pseudomonas monteilii TaxID=76759 RepID=A0A399LY46_9PSED|nr:hypothetical protein D0894_26550 [Pseudomonas monteilii]
MKLDYRANRRQASSHRVTTGLSHCTAPVGAGLPAMRPVAHPKGPAYPPPLAHQSPGTSQ